MKNKHRIKQGLLLLLTGGIALTNLGAALPAFAEDAAATPETAQTATLDPDAAVLYATCRMHLPGPTSAARGFRLRQGRQKSVCRCGRTVSWSRTAILTRMP